MIIMGIDPGFAITGFGIIKYDGNTCNPVDYGIIATESGFELHDRLKIVHERLCSLIEQYKPDNIAVEELFFNKNVKTALNVAHARGVMLLAASNSGAQLYEYTPLQVKQALSGNGRAEKSQIQQLVKILLNLKCIPKPDDAADALAIAICHANLVRYSNIARGRAGM